MGFASEGFWFFLFLRKNHKMAEGEYSLHFSFFFGYSRHWGRGVRKEIWTSERGYTFMRADEDHEKQVNGVW
jgi:hypothetical protein